MNNDHTPQTMAMQQLQGSGQMSDNLQIVAVPKELYYHEVAYVRGLEKRIEALEAALRLAEEVLSQAPFSTDIWPNGMHPQRGITIIRAALAPEQEK